MLDDLTGLGQFAVAAGLGGQIDDDRAGRHLLDRLGRNQARSRSTGHGGSGDDHVGLGRAPGQFGLLRCQFLAVASRA